MNSEFVICFLLGLSGLICHVLFDLNQLQAKTQKIINPKCYLLLNKYAIMLTIVLTIQAAYFRDLYMNFVNKYYDFDGYALISFWLLGLFGNGVMLKIISLGKKWFNGTTKN
jgi:hypothetical protein